MVSKSNETLSHFQRLAYIGKLKGHLDLFADLMFPFEIDNLIQIRIKALREELKNLS